MTVTDTSSHSLKQRSVVFVALFALLTSLTATMAPMASAASIGGDLEQWANVAGSWTKGNLNPTGSNASLYREAEAVPFKLELDNLQPGGQYTVTIGWDTTKGGKHAYDYLVTYDEYYTPSPDPCGPPLCDTMPITPDPNVTAGIGGTQDPGEFTLLGGVLDSMGGYTLSGSYGGDSTTSVPVTFTAAATSVTLLWGGHIASPFDWGTGSSASHISGSPYHMRVMSVFDHTANNNVSIGQQDRSLKSSAVLPVDAELTIDKSAFDADGARIDGPIPAGSTFSYVVTVLNTAGAGGTSDPITVNDTYDFPDGYISAGPTLDPADAGTCGTPASGAFDCDLDPIGPGESVTITIDVSVPADDCRTFTNTAGIEGTDKSDSATVTTEGCEWDVSLEKTASTASVDLGGSFSYELTATNEATATATAPAVVITDTVPSELTVDSATFTAPGGDGPCTVNGADVTCAVGDLLPGEAAVVTIVVDVTSEVDSCGEITNEGEVSVGGEFVGGDTATVEITGCGWDVSLVKTASDDEVDLGGSFTYTITATNEATATATAEKVVVTDTVPDEVTVSSASFTAPGGDGDCDVDGQDVTCAVGDLAPGASAVVTIVVDVTSGADACGEITNRAAAFVNGGENSAARGSATVEITGCDPAVAFVKTASVEEVELGGSFSYTLTATNETTATATAEKVVITDTVPDEVTVSSASFTAPGGDGDCDVDGRDVTCAVGDLAPGESAVVTISVHVTDEFDSCGEITNEGEVSVDGEFVGGDTATVEITGCDWDVSLDKTASTASVDLGGSFSYTLVATNDATATATAPDVVITDELPSGVWAVSASYDAPDGAGICDVTGQDVTCEVGDLAPGESAEVTILVSVTGLPDSCGPVTNAGAVFVDGSATAADTDSVTVEIAGCDWDVSMTKTASASEVDLGTSFSYVLTATNEATATATAADVVITDVVPGALSVVSASFTAPDGDGDCDVDGQDVTCEVGDLAPGDSAVATIVVLTTTDPDLCGAVTNDGVVTVEGEVADEASADVDIDCPVIFEEIGSIELSKVANVQFAEIGDTVVYTYEVTNTGNVTLIDIDLDDDIIGEVELSQTTLEPGESMTVTATYVVSADDVVDGAVTNIAIVGGTTPSENRVTDTASASVELVVEQLLPRVEPPPTSAPAPAPAAALPRTGVDLLLLLATALAALGVGSFLVRRVREEPDATT